MVFGENHFQTKNRFIYSNGMKHVFLLETGNSGRGSAGAQWIGSQENQICTPPPPLSEIVWSLGAHFRSNDYLGENIQVGWPCDGSRHFELKKKLIAVAFYKFGTKGDWRVFVLASQGRTGEALAPCCRPRRGSKKFDGAHVKSFQDNFDGGA